MKKNRWIRTIKIWFWQYKKMQTQIFEYRQALNNVSIYGDYSSVG